MKILIGLVFLGTILLIGLVVLIGLGATVVAVNTLQKLFPD